MVTKNDLKMLSEVAEYKARFGGQKNRPTMDEFHAMIADGWSPENWAEYLRNRKMEIAMDADGAHCESLKWFRIAVFLLGLVILLALTLALTWPF